MDAIDRELIPILRADDRTPIVALAKKLKVARDTVQNRLTKLEASGMILGYTVRLRPEAESQRVRALTTSEIEGNNGESVRRLLRRNPNAVALHTTNGRCDLIAEVRAESLEGFDRVLNSIRKIEGIANSETSILLSTHKL